MINKVTSNIPHHHILIVNFFITILTIIFITATLILWYPFLQLWLYCWSKAKCDWGMLRRFALLCQHWQITVFPSSLFAPSCKTNSAWRCGIYAIALLVQPLLDNMTPCLTSQEVSMDPILSIRNWVLALNWDISVKISQQRAGQWT